MIGVYFLGLSNLSGHEFEQIPGDSEGQGNLVCYSPQGCKESDTTKWTTATILGIKVSLLLGRWPSSMYLYTLPCLGGLAGHYWHIEHGIYFFFNFFFRAWDLVGYKGGLLNRSITCSHVRMYVYVHIRVCLSAIIFMSCNHWLNKPNTLWLMMLVNNIQLKSSYSFFFLLCQGLRKP